MKRFLFVLPMLAVIALDQATKHWCFAHLFPDAPKPFIDHVLYLTLTFNTRGAFSLFPLPNQLFIAITLLLISALVGYVFFSRPSKGFQIWMGLVLGGGIGNLIDRFRFGHVVDFLDLRFWPVFNVADSAISIALTWLVVTLFWQFFARRTAHSGIKS